MAKIGPEHALQVQVSHTVRDHVPFPHFFFSIDRSKRSAQFTHVREKARGLVAGTPDTVLIYPGLPTITIELKAKGEKVDPGSNQERVGNAIRAAGGLWSWCDTVSGYMTILQNIGIPLYGRWDLTAQHRDALLESAAIRRAEGSRSSKVRAAARSRPRPAALKAVARARAAGIRT